MKTRHFGICTGRGSQKALRDRLSWESIFLSDSYRKCILRFSRLIEFSHSLSAYQTSVINLRRDPYEKASDESGMYMNWMAHKMWAFGPAKRLVQNHLASFVDFPPRSTAAGEDVEKRSREIGEESGFSQ